MKKIINIAFCAIAMTLMASCDSFLDKGPEENLSIRQLFGERVYTERFLTNMYTGLPMEMDFHSSTMNPFVGGSDEMEVTAAASQTHIINDANLNPRNDWGMWGTTAVYARKCCMFLENIQYTPTADAAEKKRWTGEAYFLRAFYNFLSLRIYGPIIKFDRLFDIGEDFTNVERATFEECVKYIVDDCDAAFSRLPAKTDGANYGRATAAAALALKARVLLYAASPLFNGNPDYANIKNKAGENMYPAYSADRWVAAAEAAKKCIDFCEGRLPGSSPEYKLYKASSGDPVDSQYELFTKSWNEEVIFGRPVGINILFDKCIATISLNGLSQYGPTQQIVDAYRMSDGTFPFNTDEDGEVVYNAAGQPTIVPGSGYSETGFTATASPKGYWPANVSNMYVNREPRFYAHINFCGSIWKGLQSQFWYTGADGAQIGKANYTKTGYLIRKYANKNTNILNQNHTSSMWMFFRLGEVYLNYAEALNETNSVVQPDVYTYLNEIRTRGGLPEITGTVSPEEMRKLIRQERHIELAFETHRFFDTRRWLIAENTDNKVIYGMNILEGTGLNDPVFYQRTPVEKRIFISPRNYLFPIQDSERQIDPALLQNTGY